MTTEELKVIISAETDKLREELSNANKQVNSFAKNGEKSSSKFSAAMKALGKGAKVAVGAIAAVGTAIITLSKTTEEMRKEQAKLNTAFAASGSSAKQASKTYGELYRFLGDSGVATEAAAHLAKLTTNEQSLAEWTTALQGVYATFGDSLPIESLTEAANETAKVGTVTGSLADALNWAGVSEDSFNASLAAANSEAEREALIRNTLNGLYSNAAEIYEKNNKDILAQNEAQNRLNTTLVEMGKVVAPAMTAITNLAASLLGALAPALNAIMPYIVMFINGISQAVSWVVSFIQALTGTGGAAKETAAAATNITKAASGAAKLADGLGAAADAAAEVKRSTQGFDELNVVSSGAAASGGGVSTGGLGDLGGGATLGLTSSLDSTSNSVGTFAEKVKGVFSDLGAKVKDWVGLFQPTIEAWGGAFATIGVSWDNAKVNILNGGNELKEGFSTISNYILTDFVPNIANTVSTNLAPVFGDLFGWCLEEWALNFEEFSTTINNAITDIAIPAFDTYKGIVTDACETVGNEWAEHGEELLGNLSTAMEGIRELWRTFYNEVVKPVADTIISWVKKIWDENLKPLWDVLVDAVLDIANNIAILWNSVLQPVINWLIEVLYPVVEHIVNTILSIVSSVISSISGLIQGIITVIKGVIQFITGVFTGDWKKAWEGVKNIFKGIFDSLVSVVKLPLNLIIDAINTLISGICSGVNVAIRALNKLSFDVPDWVPVIGGNHWGFNISELSAPKIPKLATGGILTGETLFWGGEGGKKEAVLPLEQNTEWMDILADRIAARSNTPSKIVLMLDSKELGWATINSINGITKQTGNLQLVMV